MKVKLLIVAATLLVFAGLSFGQADFSAALLNDNTMLTTCCGSEVPLADGAPIYIYYACAGMDPDVYGAVPTTTNYTQFVLNGDAEGFGAGYFYQWDPEFQGSPGSATVCATFFFKVYGETTHYGPGLDSICVWQSGPTAFLPGPNGDVAVAGWTCHREWVYVPPQCTYGPDIFMYPDPSVGPQGQRNCVIICPDHITNICVGPVPFEDRLPIGHFEACDLDPVEGWVETGWVWTQIGGFNYYCKTVTPAAGSDGGCICFVLEFVLPVEMGDVTVSPADNSVKLSWNTRSETSLDKFVVVRNGEDIAEIRGNNSPTGANYSFTDNGAVNGTTYKYELVTVDLSGLRQVAKTIEGVTPSELAAVITEYALHQNFPNPFNPSTSIRFDLVDDNFVTLKVYNATGQEVTTLISGQRAKGVNFVNFDASNLTSGLYFYTIKAGDVYSATKKMLLVK